MIIRPFDQVHDDKYCTCGKRAFAAIVYGERSISLCENCLEELINSIDKIKNTILCENCKYFRRSIINNDKGTCIKKLEEYLKTAGSIDDIKSVSDLKKENYGEYFPTYIKYTCKFAKGDE